MDADDYIHSLLVSDALRQEIVAEILGALPLSEGSKGLDVGCGIGLQCLLSAEMVGPSGHVTGLDISKEMLEYGREMVENAGLSRRVHLQQGEAADLPLPSDTFDWVYSIDCVGYARWDTRPLLREMARVAKPGGTVAIAAWSSEQLLPGHPRLEARLQATSAGIAPFEEGMEPGQHFSRALGWFEEAGLGDRRAKSFAGIAHAPLGEGLRAGLAALFEMRWPEVESELSADDLAEYRRLCLPDSPDFVLDLPDYCASFAYTMFWGNVIG